MCIVSALFVTKEGGIRGECLPVSMGNYGEGILGILWKRVTGKLEPYEKRSLDPISIRIGFFAANNFVTLIQGVGWF